VKIKMERYGDKGWEFSVTYTDPITENEVTGRYRTNPNGDGLWTYCQSPSQWYPDGSPFMEYKQVRGTVQFWLPADRKRAYDKIRYEWGKEEEEQVS